MNYLLDTCVISDIFKKIPAVLEHFESVSPEDVCISSLTVMEIEYGLKLKPERETKIRPLWNNLLKYIHVVPYSPRCALASASIRSDLRSKGLSIGPYDVLIAGTSLAHEMTMVTSKGDEFKRVAGLIVQDWRL